MTKWVDDKKKSTASPASSTRSATSRTRIPARRSRARPPPRRSKCALAEALVDLQELTERLRRDCPGIASRPSARSSRTRSRRPTRSPTRRSGATTRSSPTSSATSCSRSTSSRCCWRSAEASDLEAVAPPRAREARAPASARVRRRRGARPPGACASAGSRSSDGPGGREGIFHDVPGVASRAALCAQGAASRGGDRLRVSRHGRSARRSRRRGARVEGSARRGGSSRPRPSRTARLRGDGRRALRGGERRAAPERRSRACPARNVPPLRRAGGTCRALRGRRGEGVRRARRCRSRTGTSIAPRRNSNECVLDRPGARAADSRLAREPDRRGRRRARVGRDRQRRRSRPAPRRDSSRRSSCATATREPTAARACSPRCANVDDGDRETRSSGSMRRISVRSTSALIELDGTKNKSRLGANAILGVSLATAKAGAADAGVSLLPLDRRRRRAHPARADAERRSTGARTRRTRSTSRSSCSSPPARTRSRKRCASAPRRFHALKDVLHERGLSTGVGDEGGFAPELDSTEAAIEAVLEAAERVGPSRARCDRARSGVDRALQRRRLPLRARGRRHPERRRADRSLLRRSPTAIRWSRSRTGSRRTSGAPGRR